MSIASVLYEFKAQCLNQCLVDTFGNFRGGRCVEQTMVDGEMRWVVIDVDRYFMDPKIRVLQAGCNSPPEGYADYDYRTRKITA